MLRTCLLLLPFEVGSKGKYFRIHECYWHDYKYMLLFEGPMASELIDCLICCRRLSDVYGD